MWKRVAAVGALAAVVAALSQTRRRQRRGDTWPGLGDVVVCADVRACDEALSLCLSERVVGFDAEWKPQR